jgi:hypothetical protein
MATLNDLLNNFGLTDGGGSDEEVKVASDGTINDEQSLLEGLLENDQEKTASEGDDMSLADLYMSLTDHDRGGEEEMLDKIAELAAEEEIQSNDENETVKLAEEYDAAGRIMARGFFDEFNKLARELEGPSNSKLPALGERGTGFQMETNLTDTGKMDTKGGDKQHANILKGQAEGPAGRAQSAMGAQFATVKNLVTTRAKQTGAQ